jgi:hypothetical protein
MICLDKLKPIPEPSGLVVKKGINIRSATSSAIPLPLSITLTTELPSPSVPAFNFIFGCSIPLTASTEFLQRLMRTCSIKAGSAVMVRLSGSTALLNFMKLCDNYQ